MMRETGIHMRGGVITERNADFCTVRTRIPAGVVTTAQLRGLADTAERFGVQELHLTTRQTVEIPHLDPGRLGEIAACLDNNGTPVGSERDEVVNIIACPGTERCKFANIDTLTIARQLDQRLFGKEMPVKMRIALSGCPNACTSPLLNEIGITGRIEPVRVPGLCTGCGTCMEYCKEEAISIRNGISVLIPDRCVKCGVCIKSCPFEILSSHGVHYLVTVGGRRGRHPHIGRELVRLTDPEAVITTVERVVQWVYRRAWSGRLLSDQMDELEFDRFREEIVALLPREALITDTLDGRGSGAEEG